MHTSSGIHHKLSFLWFIVDAASKIDSSVGEKNIAFPFSLSFKIFLFKSPRVSAGASLLSISLLLRSVLKFHSLGTALMRNFDMIFPSDGPLLSRMFA